MIEIIKKIKHQGIIRNIGDKLGNATESVEDILIRKGFAVKIESNNVPSDDKTLDFNDQQTKRKRRTKAEIEADKINETQK